MKKDTRVSYKFKTKTRAHFHSKKQGQNQQRYWKQSLCHLFFLAIRGAYFKTSFITIRPLSRKKTKKENLNNFEIAEQAFVFVQWETVKDLECFQMFFCNQFLHDKRYIKSCRHFRIKTGEFCLQFSICHNGVSCWIDENDFRSRFVFYWIQNVNNHTTLWHMRKSFFSTLPLTAWLWSCPVCHGMPFLK